MYCRDRLRTIVIRVFGDVVYATRHTYYVIVIRNARRVAE